MSLGICGNNEFLAELTRLGIEVDRSNMPRGREDVVPKGPPKKGELLDPDIVEPGKDEDPQVIIPEHGRKEGDKNVPDTLRKVIGESALTDRHSEIARAFGVSESSVSAYKVGATSTDSYHRPDKSLKEYMVSRRRDISEKAHDTLRNALGGITPDKLDATKARDLAGIAKDMSAVIRNLEPELDHDIHNTNFVFYSPRPKTEEEYPSREVKE